MELRYITGITQEFLIVVIGLKKQKGLLSSELGSAYTIL
jgi:hypothetical protein